MAQSKQSAGHEDKVLECSICLSDLVKPKQLPCLHNFCLKCLKGHCDVGKTACPICRREFIIPEGGVEMFKNNEFIERLVLEKELLEGKKEPKCELCQEIGEDVNAEAFCVECSQRLCRRCGQLHLKQTFTRLHKVVDIKEMLSDMDLQRMRPQYCSDHSGKEIELYCCDCEKLLCSLCHATEHNKHVCKVIRDIAKLKKESLLQDQNNLKKQSGNSDTKLQELNAFKEKIQTEASQAANSIEESFTKLNQQILTYKSKLLANVEETKRTRMKEIEGAIDLDELNCTELNGFISYCRMVMEKGTDCEIVRVSDDLHKRAAVLIKCNNDRNKETITNLNLKYLTPPQLTEETLQKNFGSLDLAGPDRDCKSKDISRQLVGAGTKMGGGTIEMAPKRFVNGVTVVDDQIFVLHGAGINIYDSHTLKYLSVINVPGMEDPAEITGCSFNKALYIADLGPNCIHNVVGLNEQTLRVGSWKVRKNYSPHGVFITLKHNVLVTMQWEDIILAYSLLAEYTSGGQLIWEIELDTSIEAAWQTVQLSSDKFVISHGSIYSFNRLCIIDSNGQIIKSYEGVKGQGELNEPRAIALDKSGKFIYITDKWNKRVLKFDTDLTLIGEVEMGTELYVPSCLCFDPSTDRLLVGDNPSAAKVKPQGNNATKPSHVVIINPIWTVETKKTQYIQCVY